MMMMNRVCAEELLIGWQRLGVNLAGVILQAEHKETVKEYDS